MKVQKHIEVRLLKKRLIPVIDVVQYDTGVQLVFSLVDFDIPSGTSATLYVQKRSGKFVYQEKDITISGNEITIDLENQALTEHGEAKYQIMLQNGTDTVTTFAGILRIEKSLADANAVESKTVIRAFDEAVADHVAEFQTKAEQIVAACIATIPDDYTTMEAKVNEQANAVKGNLSGAVVFADDVSTVEHNPVVKVHGKNLVNVDFIDGESSSDRAIILKDGDVIIFPASSGNVYGLYMNNSVLRMEVGKTYTASIRSVSAFDPSSYGWRLRYTDGTTVVLPHATTATFTVEKEVEKIIFRIGSPYQGNTESRVDGIQIEEGTVATEYEPYIDPSTVTVKRCGKNLLPYPFTDATVTRKGVTFTDNGDGTITVNGTAEATTSFVLFDGKIAVNGAYTLSGISGGSGSSYYIQPTCSDKAYPGTTDGGKTYEWDGVMLKRIQINVVAGTVFSNMKITPMLEIGEIVTDFELYNGTEHIPSSDGTVSGMTSVSPCMTILTDTEGAIVECEYNRDTNKVIEKLTNAINDFDGVGAVTDEQVAKAVFAYLAEHPVSAGSTATIGTVNLLAEKWVGTGNLYSQVATLAGVTENSQVDLTPSVEQLVVFYEKDLTFVTENDGGVVTVYAIGQKPENDYTIQVTITEVKV